MVLAHARHGDIGTIVDNPDCPPACPGSLILGPVDYSQPVNDPENNQIDPALRPMRLQEAVLGVEREVKPGLSVSARYIHKQVDMAVEDIGTLDAELNPLYAIGNPGYGRAATFYPQGGTSPLPFPKPKRDYDAVELALDKRLSDHWSARASYTWSRLYGNYSGLVDSYLGGSLRTRRARSTTPSCRSTSVASSPTACWPPTARTSSRPSSSSTSRSGRAWARTGSARRIPRTRSAAYVPSQAYPVSYRGRGSDGRLPFLSQLDVHLQHQLRLGGKALSC